MQSASSENAILLAWLFTGRLFHPVAHDREMASRRGSDMVISVTLACQRK
jgi:hypothetical protein